MHCVTHYSGGVSVQGARPDSLAAISTAKCLARLSGPATSEAKRGFSGCGQNGKVKMMGGPLGEKFKAAVALTRVTLSWVCCNQSLALPFQTEGSCLPSQLGVQVNRRQPVQRQSLLKLTWMHNVHAELGSAGPFKAPRTTGALGVLWKPGLDAASGYAWEILPPFGHPSSEHWIRGIL